MVDLGDMPNANSLLWSMFHGSNHLIEKGLVRVIPEIDLIHVLNFCQTEQFLFITVLNNLIGLNKFCTMDEVVEYFNTFHLTPISPS